MKHGKTETRTWGTDYRGLVLICSSVNPYSDRELIAMCGPEQYARILQLLGPKWFNVVKRGSAIAVGTLVSSSKFFINPASQDYEEQARKIENQTFVKYSSAQHFHKYKDVTPIQPFPWRGMLGWQKVTDEDKAKIKIL